MSGPFCVGRFELPAGAVVLPPAILRRPLLSRVLVEMLAEPTWRVHVSTWLRFFIGNRLGPYHAMPQHVINGLLNLADGTRPQRTHDSSLH